MLKLLVLSAFFTLGAIAQTGPGTPTEADQKRMWERYDQLVKNPQSTHTKLNADQRKLLLVMTSTNEVASSRNRNFWDPFANGRPGEIGYCFGRSMAAHLLGRSMGLSQTSFKKIYAAGDMANGPIRWRFHMATLVLGDDDSYYAVDPIMPRLIQRFNKKTKSTLDEWSPLPISKWIELVKYHYDNTKKILEKYPDLADDERFSGTIKFYTTTTDAMMVDMREIPAHLNRENGKRIIEIYEFDPALTGGFTPVYKADKPQELLYYSVDDPFTENYFFMAKNEPYKDQFNFFKLDITIFHDKDSGLKDEPRNYLYNGKPKDGDYQHFSKGYFPSLFDSVEKNTVRF